MTNFFPVVSIWSLVVAIATSFPWNFMKSLCHQSPTKARARLQMRNDYDQPADCGDITDQMCWEADRWTMNGPLSYMVPWSLQPKWAKKNNNKTSNHLSTNVHWINLCHSLGKFSRRQTNDIFLIFWENRIRHFNQIWNIKTGFLGKIR